MYFSPLLKNISGSSILIFVEGIISMESKRYFEGTGKMNIFNKRIFCIIGILIMGAVVVGCKDAENKEDVKGEEAYNQELASYFPSDEGTALHYYGTAEYGQVLILSEITDNKEKLILNFKGEIEDMSSGEGPSRDELLFETRYEINKDSVVEAQENEDRKFSQSIVGYQIVLKTPIKEGESWEQSVTIDNKGYKAETMITEIYKDEKGKGLIKTETIIKDIEFYPENTYKEFRTFKEGKGLSAFKNIILLKGSEDVDPAPFEFEYRLFEQE